MEQEALPYIANEAIASWTGKLLTEEPRPSEARQQPDVSGKRCSLQQAPPIPCKGLPREGLFEGVSSGELLCLRPSPAVEPRFLFYVLVSKGFIDTINSETFGAKMPRADWDMSVISRYPCLRSTNSVRIARFLDEKTARIDGLIEKKRELLDLLGREAPGSHHPRRHQGPQPRQPDEILWHRLARRHPRALGGFR